MPGIFSHPQIYSTKGEKMPGMPVPHVLYSTIISCHGTEHRSVCGCHRTITPIIAIISAKTPVAFAVVSPRASLTCLPLSSQ